MKKILIAVLLAGTLSSNAFAYYQAEQGRWLNRDPIQEEGGLNLNSFANNAAVNFIDLLGKDAISPWNPPAPGGYYDHGSGGALDNYFHWLSGGGDISVDFDSYDPGFSASDFDGYDGTSVCSSEIDLNVSLSKVFDSGSSAFGQLQAELNGTLSYDSSGDTWEFDGEITIADNEYNFEPRNDRTWYNELATTIARWTGGGSTVDNDYWVSFSGERSITDSGSCCDE